MSRRRARESRRQASFAPVFDVEQTSPTRVRLRLRCPRRVARIGWRQKTKYGVCTAPSAAIFRPTNRPVVDIAAALAGWTNGLFERLREHSKASYAIDPADLSFASAMRLDEQSSVVHGPRRGRSWPALPIK